jgi:hypothetical protein
LEGGVGVTIIVESVIDGAFACDPVGGGMSFARSTTSPTNKPRTVA